MLAENNGLRLSLKKKTSEKAGALTLSYQPSSSIHRAHWPIHNYVLECGQSLHLYIQSGKQQTIIMKFCIKHQHSTVYHNIILMPFNHALQKLMLSFQISHLINYTALHYHTHAHTHTHTHTHAYSSTMFPQSLREKNFWTSSLTSCKGKVSVDTMCFALLLLVGCVNICMVSDI